MTDELTKEDQSIIDDELERYQSTFDKIKDAMLEAERQLVDDQNLAREMTAAVVAANLEEDKQALQSDESVAHGLAKLRLGKSNALGELVEQPYFARVVYEENGKQIEFRLGLASFPEERIIDWRKAPISTLYYDYEEGEEYDDEIAGVEREGKIILKRAYRGKRDILAAIELKEVSYVQSLGKWQKQKKFQPTPFSVQDKDRVKELLKTTDVSQYQRIEKESGYLRQILSLLSPEQFQLISTASDQPIIIQGAAGTGKTTVALHRLAWLLFEDNSPAKAETTLVLVFNKSLAAYVSHVLPELGIQGVKIATFFDWAKDIITTSTNQEINLSEKDIPDAAHRFKSHPKTLEAFLKSLPEQKGFAILPSLFDFYQNTQTKNLVANLKDGKQIQSYLDEQVQKNEFDVEDLALLLHATYKSQGAYRAKNHPGFLDYLLVDEAQDFTVTELKAIFHALFDNRQVTLAGDLGQKIHDNRDFGGWEDLLSDLGLGRIDHINLNIAYRSTYQIYELAESIRDPRVSSDDLEMLPKFGPEPELTLTNTFADAVLETQKWIEGIIRQYQSTIGAIICRTAAEARAVYDALLRAGAHGIRFGDSQHFEFTPGITVTDVKQVKGLEFHDVLIFNPSHESYNKTRENDRNLLYVAITRAEFSANFICYEKPSRFLPGYLKQNDLTIEIQNEDQPLFSDTDQDLSWFEEQERMENERFDDDVLDVNYEDEDE